jgi:hypothetical protein
MRRLIFLAAILATALSHAGGLPYAVESLKKAQELSGKDAKHVLVFYTSEN